jgi:hypothetical protein
MYYTSERKLNSTYSKTQTFLYSFSFQTSIMLECWIIPKYGMISKVIIKISNRNLTFCYRLHQCKVVMPNIVSPRFHEHLLNPIIVFKLTDNSYLRVLIPKSYPITSTLLIDDPSCLRNGAIPLAKHECLCFRVWGNLIPHTRKHRHFYILFPFRPLSCLANGIAPFRKQDGSSISKVLVIGYDFGIKTRK